MASRTVQVTRIKQTIIMTVYTFALILTGLGWFWLANPSVVPSLVFAEILFWVSLFVLIVMTIYWLTTQ